MNLNHLREFLVTARLNSFSKAAEELFISQSSLSKHINSLEKELGVSLFDRTSRSVSVSDIGMALLPYAANILENETLIRRLCEDKQRILQDGDNRQPIHVASVPVMAAYGIFGLTNGFQQKYPNIYVRLEEREPEIIPSVLSSNQCELAFLRDTPSLQYRYDTVPLYEEKILAIVSDKHPLAGQKGIQLHDLRNDQMIFLSTKSVLYGICMDLCLSAGFLPNVIFTGNRPENILDLVSRGMGTSLLTESFYNYYKKEHTIGIEIVPTAMTRMVLAHLKDHELSIPARRFWDYVASR